MWLRGFRRHLSSSRTFSCSQCSKLLETTRHGTIDCFLADLGVLASEVLFHQLVKVLFEACLRSPRHSGLLAQKSSLVRTVVVSFT